MSDTPLGLKSHLSKDDEAFLKDLEAGQGLFQQMLNVFQGPTKGVTIFALVIAIVFTGLLFWTGWEALHATEQRALTLWCTGFLASLFAQAMLKQWFHNRMNQIMLLKELKKIEFRVLKMAQSDPLGPRG